MEGANALSRLQDDFLPMVENLRIFRVSWCGGCIHAALAKFCVAFSKATVTLAAGSMRARSVEKKSMRNFEKVLDKTEEM